MNTIQNIAFRGGGVLGAAYAGAIQVLEEKELLHHVQQLAGTSSGAIMALLLNLGYSAADIKQIVYQADFKQFEDGWNPIKMLREYGLYKGIRLLNWIEGLIANKTGNKHITYLDLYNKTGKVLKVYATDLNTVRVQEFSYVSTPNVIVAESIRASISIPLFFRAWQFSNGLPNKHVYVDGGVLYGYPITAFDNYDNTLGFFIKTATKSRALRFGQFSTYIHQLLQALLRAPNADFFEDETQEKITVTIDGLGISATDFTLTMAQKDALFAKGRQATINYLQPALIARNSSYKFNYQAIS